MADLPVVAVITAKPGSEKQVEEALNALIEPTRAEAGCVSYNLFVSAADPTTFITVETWRSQADLDAHLQTAHVQGALTGGRAPGASPGDSPAEPGRAIADP
jgi:quinol monooxygenase YgiN